MEIFVRLPVESLFQCLFVCKSWNSVITSTSFITFHRNRIVHKRTHFLIDQRERRYIPPGYALYHPHLRQTGNSITPLGVPFPHRSYSVVEVIHGVVCLASDSSIVVWNPTIRKHISFENIKFAGEYPPRYFGFGFSSVNKDFKVVAHMQEARQYYDVLSVKGGCWRRETLGDDIYPAYGPFSNSRFLDGTIYWIACRAYTAITGNLVFSILSFDCETEVFKIMDFPPELHENHHRLVALLLKFGNKLSMLRQTETPQHPYELWVMEDAASMSWVKLFTIKQAFRCMNLVDHDIFLGQDGSVAVCKRDKQPSVDLPCRLHEPLNALVFEESLFLIDVHTKARQKVVKLHFGFRSKLALFLAVSSKLLVTLLTD